MRQTDRQTDDRTPDRYISCPPDVASAIILLPEYWQTNIKVIYYKLDNQPTLLCCFMSSFL